MLLWATLSHSPLETISFWLNLFLDHFGAKHYKYIPCRILCLQLSVFSLLPFFSYLHHFITLLPSNTSDSFPYAFFPQLHKLLTDLPDDMLEDSVDSSSPELEYTTCSHKNTGNR